MLSIEELAAGYGEMRVLHDVNLWVNSGEIVTLLGANGAGKSTLLRTVSGLVTARAGRVVLNGKGLNGLQTHDIVELGISMVPEGRGLFPFMTVEENLEVGSFTRRARSERRRNLDRVYDLLPRLKERRHQLGGSLSGGEQQMCAIARGIMAHPQVLLLDEPSLGLAPMIVRDVFTLIRQLREAGLSILLVEQHITHALTIADRAYVLQNGRIIASGRSSDLASDPALKRAYLGKQIELPKNAVANRPTRRHGCGP
jgi:branched-chain amino acid transport system ATP-binding protein